jgi:MFS superfamily sulfate permease-like transporter
VTNSFNSHETSTDAGIPRYEPWLGMTAGSLVPIIAIFMLPQAFMWPMIALGALLLGAGLVMLVRQERGVKQARTDT